MKSVKRDLRIMGLGAATALMLAACASRDNNGSDDGDSAPVKTENVTTPDIATNNAQLIESERSKVKFAMAAVENYYPYIYWCGKAWTTGHGLTILYNADGSSYTKVTQNTKVPTLEESDIYKGRYMNFEVYPDIKKYITAPLDENTLLAACVLRYCIGGKNFKKSSFVKQLNAGVHGEELAKTLTGWRQDHGILKRCYFFAAMMSGKMQYSQLLDMQAEGCYNLKLHDIVVYENGKPKKDENNFYEWDFSKLQSNLEKAKAPRTVTLNLGNKKHVTVVCQPTKDIVPDYIWQEVQASVNTKKFKILDPSFWRKSDATR